VTLPTGWTKGTLRVACSLLTDGTHHSPTNSRDGDFPYVTAKNIKWAGLDLRDLSYVSRRQHEEIYRRCPVELGDVLLVKDGATTGVAAVNSLHEPFSMLSSVALLRPVAELLNNRFLWHWLRSDAAQDALTGAMSGTAIRRLTLTTIGRTEIPIPPEPEQRRIVAKLDALTSRTSRARAELGRVPILAANLRRKALGDEFSASVTDAIPLASFVEDVRYGTAKKCDYGSGGTPVLRIPNVQSGRISLADLKFADFDEREIAKLALRAGDVLVIRSNGSLDLVGRSAVVSEDAAGMLFAGYLIRLRPNLALIRSEYLQYYLSSPNARSEIESSARSTSGVNNVNAEQLKALRVPKRSINEQTEAVTRIKAAFAHADRLEAEATRAATLLDQFEAAILTRAFRGELVNQDPNDQPASVLIGRIRAERAAMSQPGRHRRTKAA
jgi:type I restriction enzyme, S subunit